MSIDSVRSVHRRMSSLASCVTSLSVMYVAVVDFGIPLEP